MPELLRLFVSATNDLEAERAIIGRSVAELPVQIGIEIRRTPPLLPTYEEVFEKLDAVDRVYFLLGNDITAPAGPTTADLVITNGAPASVQLNAIPVYKNDTQGAPISDGT